jgi:hypothetical protein
LIFPPDDSGKTISISKHFSGDMASLKISTPSTVAVLLSIHMPSFDIFTVLPEIGFE